jgi:hypothetical protein
MPSLDLPNLAEITQQKQTTPPPIAMAFSGTPIVQATPTTPPTQTCAPSSFNLAVEQGATLSSQITIQLQDANGVLQPVNITGYNFQFTAKIDPNLPDSDPSTVMINWQETNTPTQGVTWLVIPAATTQAMQAAVYYYQIRMKSPSAVVTPVANGTLTIVQPISSRF